MTFRSPTTMIDHPRLTNRESIACMEELDLANKRLNDAHDKVESAYVKLVEKLCNEEKVLANRLEKIATEIDDTLEEHGNIDAADDDVFEINVGGKIIIVKRSTLTQHTMGTRFGALFNGRWEKKMQRDMHGRIFLDVNPECFQAIVAYLNEMMISSEDNLPDPPSVDDELKIILSQQLALFGLREMVGVRASYSDIVSTEEERSKLRTWLENQGLFGELQLIYSGNRDGLEPKSVRNKCDKEKCVVFIVKSTNERDVYNGSTGYYDTKKKETTHVGLYAATDKFVDAVGNTLHREFTFSSASRFALLGEIQTEWQHWSDGGQPTYTITHMEAFKASGPLRTAPKGLERAPVERALTNRFSEDVNKAINEKQACLPKAELKIRALEDSFKDEQKFIDTFARGDTKDVVALNVSGTPMVTRRLTLCIIEGSVLAEQFNDSKWEEQAYAGSRVKSWSPDEVCAWTKNIEGVQDDVSSVFKRNGITGCELLALNMDGLRMLGIERAGTLCLLKKEIETLEKASQAVTLIDHCPYCFGKILDFLRMKQAHSLGLADEPSLPEVVEAQKKRFEKVVKFYFPGDAAKHFLG